MINKDLRNNLANEGYESAVVFNDPSFDKSIVGYTTNGAVVYDYLKMIEEYMNENNCSEADAMQFIEYNTLRTIPYMNDDKHVPPVVMFPVNDLMEY